MPKTFAHTPEKIAAAPTRTIAGSGEHRVDVERGRRSDARAGQQPHDERGSREGEREAGHEEEPARRVEEKEAQVPPAVAPRPEVRRPRAAVLAEAHGDLGDLQAEEHRLDDHLARVLHARRPEVEAEQRVAAEAAQAAVEVRDVVRKKSRPSPVRTGFPSQRWSGGIAPFSITPLKREPMTRSAPASSALTKSGTAPKS